MNVASVSNITAFEPTRNRPAIWWSVIAASMQAAVHAGLLLSPFVLFGLAEFDNSATMAVIALCGWSVVESWLTRRHDEPFVSGDFPDRRTRQLSLVTALLVVSGFWAALIQRIVSPQEIPFSLRIGGGILLATGISLRCLAILWLGKHFVSAFRVAAGQPLVQDGPYALMRHPSETGLYAIALGTALWLGSVWSVAIVLLGLMPMSLWRVRLEERRLFEGFGDRYAAYALKVRRFVPLIF